VTPARLYLDQKDWIQLAKLRAGDPTVEQLRPAGQLLAQRVVTGGISVPLSQNHVLETWNTRDAGQRFNLASVMLALSRRAAIAPMNVVWKQELDQFLGRQFGVGPGTPPTPFGTGLMFALGLTAEEVESYPQEADVPLMEFLVLSEPEGVGSGLRERADQRRAGWIRWAQAGEAAAAQLLPDRGRYNEQDRLAAVTLSLLGNQLIDQAIGRGAHETLLAFLRSEGPWALVRQLPSLATFTELHRLRYPNVSRPWEAQDYHDLQSLSVALAYCDGVLPDRFWGDIARRSAILTNRGVIVESGRDALGLILPKL
jgi:hypothetical protein